MRRHRTLTALLLAAGILAAGGCTQDPPVPCRPAPSDFQARLLATIPSDVHVLVPPAFSPDGRCAVYVARAGGSDRPVRGGRSGPPYENI